MIIEDKEGNKYQVDMPNEDGTSDTEQDPADTGGQRKPTITPIGNVSSEFDTGKLSEGRSATIRFTKGKGKYAFDSGKEPWYQSAQLLKQYYPPLASDYIAPWKLVPIGENDVVEAELTGATIDKQKVKFVLKDGTPLPARLEKGKWQISLPSVKAGETYEVFALYEEKKGKTQTLGKLGVVSYPKQNRTITLVTVDGTPPDLASVEEGLNRIYNPYGVSITVNSDNCLKGNKEWDADGDGRLNLNGSGFFSKETDEMKALRKLYQQTSDRYDRNSYYIFVVDKAIAGNEPDSELAVQGDMPRGKQFGYIFTQEVSNTPRLIAHELGHGIFTLRHSFDVNYSGDKFKATTSNLMDYNNGEELAVWQWNILANPAPLTWFDSENDGMAIEDGVSSIAELYQKYAVQYKGGVYMALHGFSCDELNTSSNSQATIKYSDFNVVSFKTVKLNNKKGVTAIIFRISYNATETRIESEQRQVTLNRLKVEIQREVNSENDFLHFYKSDEGNFIPLKKSNEWQDLRTEVCGISHDDLSEAYQEYGKHILQKLLIVKAKNSILFVNGYEITEEFLNSEKENDDFITGNTIKTYDGLAYWNGIDRMFKERRAAGQCYYANGHMSITTSNHRTVQNFISSLASFKSPTPILPTPPPLPPIVISPHLNTEPNVEGFNKRMENGRAAGIRFVDILRKEGYAAGDTLDIVAHSMGFAYAQGIIQVIEEAIHSKTLYIHLGGYYIIAPENGCSGRVEPTLWDEIWQYGSNEQSDLLKEQDGVAPQCKVGNLDNTQRAFIPNTEPRGFIESHKIKNYQWIFNIKQEQRGYVTSR